MDSHIAREHHDEEEVMLQSTPPLNSKQEKWTLCLVNSESRTKNGGRTSDDELQGDLKRL